VNRIARPLFVRHAENPILRAAQWPYPVHSVFNPGATLLADGTTLLLCRVEDHTGLSHLSAARSTNGIDGWTIDLTPTLARDPVLHPEELWGLEDPRITHVPELDRHAVAYTAFGQGGPGVALALTRDFRSFERLGLAMQPDDQDAALLPRRIHGSFALVHRPMRDDREGIWISYSADLRNWGGHRPMLRARRGGWWDAQKIGVASPPIETPRGWLMLYHGVRRTASGSLYRLGAALFELEAPEVCIARGSSWIFGPEELYEIEGDVPRVVFPCGVTCTDGDTLYLYYGAADSCIGLARGSVGELLAWLDEEKTRAPMEDGTLG
jgi:predicted GH43/DUF377 family glycosyl hydrolase